MGYPSVHIWKYGSLTPLIEVLQLLQALKALAVFFFFFLLLLFLCFWPRLHLGGSKRPKPAGF